jgi:integrase
VNQDVILLRAEKSKSRKPVTVPIDGELAEIIDRRRAARVLEDDGGTVRLAEYVFHHDGQPIGDIRKAWATACVAAGVGEMFCPACRQSSAKHTCPQCKVETKYRGKLFHDFRRTAACNMVRAGVAQSVAMQITGHRTDSMFRRYAIVSEGDKREALRKTQAHLASKRARRGVVTMKKAAGQ